MERKIVVYGHGDKRPHLGFPTEGDMEQWIKEDISLVQYERVDLGEESVLW